ncbi:uncharacterized protein LOC8066654 [Sorghum bicolor]|uniref:uncharacterized protein LOC8066654 n=1 Tax=Sorghum bicolor TaxID=4558 RepID=UPI000B4247F6|nr:uncharacterized protein LOC8066654 [Sorghum bicolor]XP_021303975.1 uncharacterized protein LOC8066654 [Sorghum bicolor]XP_021303976.1 uncharacterized protein LOC8066654 [Sorghum bicolor]|eukprot:XP_021303974.1 uncharacterized protein LOC8066654 [Sorghum bicolor]
MSPPFWASRLRTHLSELGRLPFLSTIQEFSDRFQAVLCHAQGISTHQKAELFVEGLLEHIRVDVELCDPPDLQTAMHLARAFERRAAAVLPAPPPCGARPPQRPGLPAPPRVAAVAPLAAGAPIQQAPANVAPPAWPFRRLSPAEMLERRQQGLCYNYDEPYVRGHVCPLLFFLESNDYVDADVLAAEDDGAGQPAQEAPVEAANALVVSLHAVAGIRIENTMLLPVMIKERLLALLDTGSTHNFLQSATMRRLGLSSTSSDQLRVTVTNGDCLACVGIAHDVPIIIGDESSISCVGLDLGCFDFILGVKFLRTLSPILWDFEAMPLSFWRQGQQVLWKGVGGPNTAAPQQHVAAITADPHQPPLDLSHRDRGSTRRSSFPGTSSQIAERERAGTATGTPTELDPAARGNSTAPPWELDRAAAGTEGQAPHWEEQEVARQSAAVLHRGKVREAKRKRSALSLPAAPINQHRQAVSLLHFSIFLVPRPSLFSAPVFTFQYPVPPTLLPLICNGVRIGV